MNIDLLLKREQFVKSLDEYLKIDVYGKYSTLHCGSTWWQGHEDDSHCMQMVNQTYKFYLALENSVCEV